MKVACIVFIRRNQLNYALAGLAGVLQNVDVLLVRRLGQRQVLPQIGRQKSVRLDDGRVGSLGKVTQRGRRTARRRVAILDTAAIWSSFFGTGANTMPVPRRAGMRRTRSGPHLPKILQGTVWGLPILLLQ